MLMLQCIRIIIASVLITEYTNAFSPSFINKSHRSQTRVILNALSNDIQPGRIVEYSAKGASTSTLGAIVEPDGKHNWKVLTPFGHTISVPPRNIRYIVPGGRATTRAEIEAHQNAASKAMEEAENSNGADVATVWEMLLEDGENEADLQTLADLIIGDASSLACYATRAVLTSGAESACYFKEAKGDNNMFELRPLNVVEALRTKARTEAKSEEKWTALRARIDAACSGTTDFLVDNETDDIQTSFQDIQRLGCLAKLSPKDAMEYEQTDAEDTPARVAARAFLKQLGRKGTAEAARVLLIGTGVWETHENLDVIRQRIPMEFSPFLEELSSDLTKSPPLDQDEGSRLDLTHLPAFAIDEATTREIDDALSIEVIADDAEGAPMHARQRMWVHIADPTRYVALGTPLEKEARRRMSSLYLPTGTVPMFPMTLASGPLSLSPGEVSSALSIGVMLDQNGAICEENPPIITPSLVRTTRLTYDQVDRILDPSQFGEDSSNSDEETDIQNNAEMMTSLRRLQWASGERLEWRKACGSLESIGPYELPDMSIKAWTSPDELDGWGVAVCARGRHLASRIVTELMLLANEAIATYGHNNGVPMPFRSQEVDGVSDNDIDSTPEGPCRAWLAIRSTRPSRISSVPLPHEGLGLDYYVQATSPVRRYADLALHYQLKAHLRGEELPFPAIDGESTIVRLAQTGNSVSRPLERSANAYWLQEFLRRRAGKPVSAVVLSGDRRQNDLYKLLLPELGEIITYRSSRPLVDGTELKLSPSANGEFI